MTGLPRLDPRPGGFEVARHRGRRRRLAKATGLLGAASAALVVVLMPHGDGLLSLTPQPAPPAAQPSETAEPTETPSAAPTSPTPTGEPTRDPATESPSPAGSPTPPAGDDGDPYASEPPTLPDSEKREYVVTRSVTGFDGDTAGCISDDYYSTPMGWCFQSPDSWTVASGSTVSLWAQICRLDTAGDGRLHFYRGDHEADFDVDRYSRKEWTTSTSPDQGGEDYAVAVKAGSCARWTVRWDTRDDAGDLLAPSPDYTLSVGVYARTEVANQPQSGSSVTGWSTSLVITDP